MLPATDKGRFNVSKTASDEYVFRAAPLRNVALRAPYFHSGQVWSLKQAVGVMGSSQLGATLTDKQEDDIVAFLGALTGELPQRRSIRRCRCAPEVDAAAVAGEVAEQTSRAAELAGAGSLTRLRGFACG